ncbi:TfoX/Sxy family protein [Candidatus Acetothermia bacterium]|nr:TfoX/Sxy family protein [Candidatus Acetothermia bacterium]
MTKDSSFHDYVVYDLLTEVSGITSRAMFGGWGIYKNGLIFGIIFDDELFFKVNDENRVEFERSGSHPLVYANRDGKESTLSYWLITEEVMEDREKLGKLMESSLAVSRKGMSKRKRLRA